MKFLVGIASTVGSEASLQQLRQALPPGIEVVTTSNFDELSDEQLEGGEVLITALVPVRAALIEKLPGLRVIQACSHGYDHIDVEAATRRGIPVCNVASSSAEDFDVAELAMLFMLALSRRLIEAQEGMAHGDWNQPYLLSQLGLTELHGKTLGIVGLGRIGTDLALKAQAFGMKLIFSDVMPKPQDLLDRLGATPRDLDDLMREADYISINVNLDESTTGLIDARRLGLMKKTAFIVNTARGAIVGKEALAQALHEGRIAGAAADVFDVEPPPPDHPWLHAPRMYVTPHLGGTSREAIQRIGQAGLMNVFRMLQGEPLRDVVNGVQGAAPAPAPSEQGASTTAPSPLPAATSYGMQRQTQVYLGGLQGQRPQLPVAAEDLERAANAAMTPEASGYLGGMADSMRENLAAFRRWRIIPRLLRNVAERDLSIELFNHRYPAPLLLAPIGVHSIVHAGAEAAVGRAAASLGIPLIFSTASSTPLEKVAQAMGTAPRWFQLYWSKDPDFNASIVARAEAAGCEAIVVTLDTYLLAWRPLDIQNAYLPFLLGQGIGNYLSDPAFRKALAKPPEEDPRGAIQHFIQIFTNPSLTWQDLGFLRERTKLPILLKGILHPDDARQAIDAGMDGVIVSNHGGRQVEGAIASLDALPPIAEAVGDRVPILLDSGIRRASDVLKAVALGAKGVLLGRPYMWGLALGGEAGVREVLANFLADLDLTLALSGYKSFSEIDKSAVVRGDDLKGLPIE